MGKYEVLGRYLSQRKEDELVLTFNEIQEILGFKLPYSARKYKTWWGGKDPTHAQALDGWINWGRIASELNMSKETIKFKKVSVKKDRLKKKNTTLLDFKLEASRTLSKYFGADLRPRKSESFPKIFDLVSEDYSIVGDTKYMIIANEESTPLAKFSIISEHVWFLEKLRAEHRFLVFGNQKEVPVEWLKRYGRFVTNVNFYFIDEKGHLSKLN